MLWLVEALWIAYPPEPILRNVREWNRTTGIVIHTIGLSGPQNVHLLRRLAEENGGPTWPAAC
jgi:hypothetical protein